MSKPIDDWRAECPPLAAAARTWDAAGVIDALAAWEKPADIDATLMLETPGNTLALRVKPAGKDGPVVERILHSRSIRAEVHGILDGAVAEVRGHESSPGPIDSEDAATDPRFAETLFAVEADSFSRYMLWLEFAASAANLGRRHPDRIAWEQDNHGLSIEIGTMGGRPVCVDLLWVRLGPNLRHVLFYSGCSQVVDHAMIEDWLDARCDPRWDRGRRKARTDASNFHHVLSALREA